MNKLLPRIAVFSLLAGLTALIACEDTPTAPAQDVVEAVGTPIASIGKAKHLPTDCTVGQSVTWDGSEFVCTNSVGVGHGTIAHALFFASDVFTTPSWKASSAFNIASIARTRTAGEYRICLDPSIDLSTHDQILQVTPQTKSRLVGATFVILSGPDCLRVQISDLAGNFVNDNFFLAVF